MSTEVKQMKDVVQFKVDIASQVEDGLFTGEDFIQFCNDKMKVQNSKNMAKRKIKYENNYDSVNITTEAKDLEKKNLKLYIKRFLRSKALKDFIKVRGISTGFKLEYVNKIDDDDEA